MAYTPTVWATGDVITAEKLNNMENGIVANEEAAASAAPPYVITGELTVDPQTGFFTGFTADSASVSGLSESPDSMIKARTSNGDVVVVMILRETARATVPDTGVQYTYDFPCVAVSANHIASVTEIQLTVVSNAIVSATVLQAPNS